MDDLVDLHCVELYSIPRQYDIECEEMKDDIPYYLGRLGDGPPGAVLELGCGTGRVTLELARLGHDMVGLDVSGDMLGRAREKAAEAGLRVEWVQADCRDFGLGRAFPRVIFPYNSLCHLHDRESLEACFSRVREHLAPGGRFILDLVNPSYELLTCDADSNPAVAEYLDASGPGMVVIREHAVYDELTQVKRIAWTYWKGDCLLRTSRLDMRLFYPQEVEALLHYSGLRVVERTGGYDGMPFVDGSPRQMLVCEAAVGTR